MIPNLTGDYHFRVMTFKLTSKCQQVARRTTTSSQTQRPFSWYSITLFTDNDTGKVAKGTKWPTPQQARTLDSSGSDVFSYPSLTLLLRGLVVMRPPRWLSTTSKRLFRFALSRASPDLASLSNPAMTLSAVLLLDAGVPLLEVRAGVLLFVPGTNSNASLCPLTRSSSFRLVRYAWLLLRLSKYAHPGHVFGTPSPSASDKMETYCSSPCMPA